MKPCVKNSMKITRPSALGIIRRERLFSALRDALRKPILWITSPGGSGKTTLVTSFIDSHEWACLWFQCDEGDSDLASFYYYLGLAVQNAYPRRRTGLPLLTPEYALGLSSFNKRYFEQLFELLSRGHSAQDPVFLVFDNFQAIARDAPLHDLLVEGFELIPAAVHVVIISRSEPDATHMRWLANDRMTVLGYDEIRFSPEESRSLVLERYPSLSDAHILGIQEKTEGWAAGIVLMLEKGSLDGSLGAGLDTGFAYGRVFDYFAGEIFDKQEEEVQTFLLRTAFLPVLDLDLVKSLTGNGRTQQILAGLHSHNYFTDRLVGREPVFRYHALFRAFLINQAKARYTFNQIADLQVEAALILEGSNHLEEAARLFREAGDSHCLARMIKTYALGLLHQGRNKVLHDWAAGIPPEEVEKDPWLCYWLGMSMLPFNMPRARRYLEGAFSQFRRQNEVDGSYMAWAGILDTYAFDLDEWSQIDDCIEAFEHLQREVPQYPSREIELLAASRMLIALVLRRTDEYDRILQWSEHVEALLAEHPSEAIYMEVTFFLSVHFLWRGEYHKNRLLLEKASAQFLNKQSPAFVRIRIGMMRGVQAWVMAEYGEARTALQDGLSLAEQSGVHVFDSLMWSFLTAIELARGRFEEAKKALLNQMRTALATNKSLDVFFLHINTAWQELLRGNVQAAAENLEALAGMAKRMGNPYYTALWNIGMTQVALQRGRVNEAEAFLGRIHLASQEIKSEVLEWFCLLLRASCLLREAIDERGLHCLRQALVLGKEKGFFHLEFYQPALMQQLCAIALAHGIETEYVASVIRKLELAPPPSMAGHLAALSYEDWPYPLKIYTLGKFEIHRQGQPLVFTGKVQKKPLDMLKAIIAFGGDEVPEEELIDALWPDATGDLAQKSFEMTLGRLRKLLGDEEAVRHGSGQLSLDPGRCWVDILVLENQLRAARQRVEETAHEHCKLAIALYKGPFLPADSHLDWVLTRRESLRSSLMRIIISTGCHYEQLGSWEQAIECFERGLAIDRLAEVAYRHVMDCCRQAGDYASVVRAYERCCAELRKNLGISPSPETTAIYASVCGTDLLNK